MEQFLGLISKVSVLLVFIFTSVIIGEFLGAKRRVILKDKELSNDPERFFLQIVQGLVFSFLIVIEMLTAFEGPNGIRYDSRVVLLNLSATYGPVSGLVSVVTAIIIRLRHRAFYTVAISSLVFIYLLELVFIYYKRKKGIKSRYLWIYAMSFLTNVFNGVYITIVAGDEWKSAIVPVITYIVVFPIFTVIAYSVMNYIKGRDELLKELSERDVILQQKNDELLRMNDSLKENELRLRTMFSNSGEAILLIDNYMISEINLRAIELLGYRDKKELIGMSLVDLVLEIKQEGALEKSRVSDICRKVREGENIKAEVVMRTKGGSEVPLEVFMVDIKVPGVEYIYMSARDIRERKRKEREILYKARHDVLTTVANRQYFEETMGLMISEPKNYPLAFMMADINGLKIVNDIFGHAEGDMLIVKIADTLTKVCRHGDIVARIGGDEFAILLARADEAAVRVVIERVKKSLKSEKVESLEPSLSIGYAIKASIDEDLKMEDLSKQADEMMYKNKMEDRKTNVRIFLNNMVNRLYEKSPKDRDIAFILTKYLERIKNIDSFGIVTKREVSKLIRYVNLGKLVVDRDYWDVEGETIDELGISDKLLEASENILSKIAHAEDNIIKRDELLKMNERFDGAGKFGMKGEEIPLTIRTFRILFDLYFIMDNKEQFGISTEQDALAVLLKYSDTKYDPKLFFEVAEALKKNK